MLKFFKKEEQVVDHVETREVEGAEVWIVSWNARYGAFCNDYKIVAKSFLNEDDADTFIKSLEEAAKLLQYTENLKIEKTKQS